MLALMKRVLILLLCISYFNCYAQNRNSVWIFGDSAGIDFSNLLNPIPISSGMDGRGSCTSISDSVGNLIFYSYTRANTSHWSTLVHNSLNNQIQNGDSITGSAWYNELAIIPQSQNLNRYFLFSCGLSAPNNEGLYYSIVDMNLNSGLGAVTFKNIQLNPNAIADGLSAVKHGNGRDWWLICKLSDANTTYHNRFFRYLLLEDSIIDYSFQDFNDARDAGFQKLIWSSFNEKFMLINTGGYMSEFEFDRCNGNISLIRNIFPQQTSNYNRLFWEGAYSPSGDIFYVSTSYWINLDTACLLQLNLLSPDIPGTIDTLERFVDPIGTGAPRLAPDGKIYFSRPYLYGFPGFPYPDSTRNYINENLSVINSPDSLGTACDYQPFSFYLGGKRTYYGLPNNPNYDLGPLAGSVCDTLTIGIETNSGYKKIKAYPNPFTVKINFDYVFHEKYKMIITDIAGKIVYEANMQDKPEIELSFLQHGLYFVTISDSKSVYQSKIIKQ